MSTDPDLRQQLVIVRNNLRTFGLRRTLFDVIGYLFTAPPRDDFDRRHGLQTAGFVEKAQLGVTDPNAIKYVPIIEPVMRHVLAEVGRIADLKTLSFLDLGCGKGRALVIASWYPFRAIHGVELSASLAELAQRNATTYLAAARGSTARGASITVTCGNALDCDLPAGDLLVFLHRPFKGQVFRDVLDRLHGLAARTGHRILVAYICPIDQTMLERHPGFRKIHDCQVIVKDHSWSLWEAVAEATPRPAAS